MSTRPLHRVWVALAVVTLTACTSATPSPVSTLPSSSGWIAVIDVGSTLRIVKWDGVSPLPEGRVVTIDRDRQVSSSVWPGMDVNDDMTAQEWGYRRVGADRPAGFGAAGVIVAVIDTGVDGTHPDLAGVVTGTFDAKTETDDASDRNGHGTHVAGIIAADHNTIGVDGAAPSVRILAVRALNADGVGEHSDIARGIIWAVDSGASVINLSLGGPESSTVLAAAVDYAVQHDVVVVAAAGNGALEGNEESYPAAYPSVLAVGAVGPDDRSAMFSTTGSFVDVAAPGVGIVSTVPGGYGWLSGTSQATPFVSAAAARLRGAHPQMTAETVITQIEATAYDVGPPGRDDTYGFGIVDIGALAGLTPTNPSEAPTDLFAPIDLDAPTVPDELPTYANPTVPAAVLTPQVSLLIGPGPVPFGSTVEATVFVAGAEHLTLRLSAPGGEHARFVAHEGRTTVPVTALASGSVKLYNAGEQVASAEMSVVPVLRVTMVASRSGVLHIAGSVTPSVGPVTVEALVSGAWIQVGTIDVTDGRFSGTVPVSHALLRLGAGGGSTAPFHT